ncbi:hypothetical protein [Staphylococcus phage vB_SauM-V1SA15]|nr:hypothetical protein [Staphylococcus phage vB_SauM-V1SA15]
MCVCGSLCFHIVAVLNICIRPSAIVPLYCLQSVLFPFKSIPFVFLIALQILLYQIESKLQ